MSVFMSRKEANAWDFRVLLIFSIVFLVVLVPCFVAGYYDEENFVLFLVTLFLVSPQMIVVWFATYTIWRNKRRAK